MVRTVSSGSLIATGLQCLLNQPDVNCHLPLMQLTAPAMKPLLLRVDGTVRFAKPPKRSATTKETAKKNTKKVVGALSAL